MLMIMIMRTIAPLALLAAIAASFAPGTASAQRPEPLPAIQFLMTADEFSAAGLHRLSVRELAELNRWLLDYTVVVAQYVAGEDLPQTPLPGPPATPGSPPPAAPALPKASPPALPGAPTRAQPDSDGRHDPTPPRSPPASTSPPGPVTISARH
jgi:hypothetical protein